MLSWHTRCARMVPGAKVRCATNPRMFGSNSYWEIFHCRAEASCDGEFRSLGEIWADWKGLEDMKGNVKNWGSELGREMRTGGK